MDSLDDLDRTRITAYSCAVLVIAVVVFLPTISTAFTSGTTHHEVPDSAHGRVLDAVYSLNDTDYLFERKNAKGIIGVTRIENSDQEMSHSEYSQTLLYQYRDIQWIVTSDPRAADYRFSIYRDYCRERNPFDISNLRTRNHTVLNDSASNTTVRYVGPVLRGGNQQVRDTIVSLDAEGRIETVTTRIDYAESHEKTGLLSVIVDSYRNYGNTTVERPPLPFSLEAEIVKRWAVLSGEPAGCG